MEVDRQSNERGNDLSQMLPVIVIKSDRARGVATADVFGTPWPWPWSGWQRAGPREGWVEERGEGENVPKWSLNNCGMEHHADQSLESCVSARSALADVSSLARALKRISSKKVQSSNDPGVWRVILRDLATLISE